MADLVSPITLEEPISTRTTWPRRLFNQNARCHRAAQTSSHVGVWESTDSLFRGNESSTEARRNFLKTEKKEINVGHVLPGQDLVAACLHLNNNKLCDQERSACLAWATQHPRRGAPHARAVPRCSAVAHTINPPIVDDYGAGYLLPSCRPFPQTGRYPWSRGLLIHDLHSSRDSGLAWMEGFSGTECYTVCEKLAFCQSERNMLADKEAQTQQNG